MGLLSNRIGKESLKAGDHIYSWSAAWVYAHHGIYVGDDKVIHFTRSGQEVGTGTVVDILLVSSAPKRSNTPCPSTQRSSLPKHEEERAPSRSDPDDTVIRRAKYLLNNGFRCYNLFKSNCEDFAIYCKTGLLVAERGVVGQSGQAISIIGGPLAAVVSTPFRLVTTNIYGMAVMAVGVYCASRYAADIGNRRDVVKVEVEDLTAGLASGRIRAVENIAQLVAPAAESPATATLAETTLAA
ncbi:unnamed protein product [Miscanthus lutarioriparius]|uniref:LRAT domain-containing protein n=1 Tax=Miscanthus lutarioriparius TaxID=422564 RepID=A0A811RPY7_9POAL|nr:unnamed protein product [Miscanthus lutarioriparius]